MNWGPPIQEKGREEGVTYKGKDKEIVEQTRYKANDQKTTFFPFFILFLSVLQVNSPEHFHFWKCAKQ